MVAIAAAALLHACSGTGGEPELPAGTVYTTGFYLTIGDIASEPPATASQAPSRTPQGEYNPGEGIENYIDLLGHDIRFVLLDNANNFLGNLLPETITPMETWDSSKRYYVEATTTADLSGGRFKIMVAANWGSYPTAMTPSDAWKARYNFAGGTISKEQPIPLYGIREFAIDNMQPDVTVNIGTIHLLRALAKIEVIIKGEDATTMDHFTIGSLKLSNYNDGGYCAPYGVDRQDQYVKDQWSQDYVQHTSIPSDIHQLGAIDFLAVAGKTGHYVLYVPEYDNSDITRRATIDLTVADEMDSYSKSFTIWDPDAPAVATNFLRNVWYRLTVTVRRKLQDPIVEVDVIPYKTVDLDPIFGLTPTPQ